MGISNFILILASEIAKTSSLMKGNLVEDIGNLYYQNCVKNYLIN